MKPSNIFFLAAVIGLALGLADVGNSMVSGFLRGIGAVLFIIAFITRVVEKAEATS